jgi:hypothetical protein
MAAVQLMSRDWELVTGRGLAGVVRRTYSRYVLWGACTLLLVANIFNIGADLGGMGEATAMGYRHQHFLLESILCGSDDLAFVLDYLSGNRKNIQMAYPDAFRLRNRGGSWPQPDWRAVVTSTIFPHMSGPLATWQRS